MEKHGKQCRDKHCLSAVGAKLLFPASCDIEHWIFALQKCVLRTRERAMLIPTADRAFVSRQVLRLRLTRFRKRDEKLPVENTVESLWKCGGKPVAAACGGAVFAPNVPVIWVRLPPHCFALRSETAAEPACSSLRITVRQGIIVSLQREITAKTLQKTKKVS